MKLRRVVIAALAAAGVLLPAAGASAAAPAMRLGFSDMNTFRGGDPASWPLNLEHLKAARGTTLRVMWEWSDVERTQAPDAASAADPAYAGYSWTALDQILRDTAAAGVTPLLELHAAPRWWEGSGRPPVSKDVPSGGWRPDAAAYGRFVTAAAKRYSGTYPDPLRPGQTLPRVRFWQIWNEPNLPEFLTPQWRKVGDSIREASPDIYRRLLAAGYDALKSINKDNVVVSAGTAPYGEYWTGGRRMPPARFTRALLCITGGQTLKARDCRKRPAKFDILAHHPYPIGPPGRRAINVDDVVVPDFAKLTKPLALAIEKGNVVPRKPKQVWATEISWDSLPDPRALTLEQQARYLAGAVYVLWRQGVDAMLWWNMRDDAKGSGYEYSLQSGVYFRGDTVAQDTPKPSLTAFRFPFVAYRQYTNFRGRGSARLWGMAPRPGAVSIQRLRGGRWTTVRRVKAAADRHFLLRLAAGRGTRLRAVQDGEASIDAKVF